MTSPSLELQAAIRAALIADPGVTALVPPANIYDRSRRPEVFPSVILGEDMEQDAGLDENVRCFIRVTSTIHVWQREPSSVGVKRIAAVIRAAVATRVSGFEDVRFESARFIRDPDGETAHGIITFESIVRSPA
jgi:hypothetical protein